MPPASSLALVAALMKVHTSWPNPISGDAFQFGISSYMRPTPFHISGVATAENGFNRANHSSTNA